MASELRVDKIIPTSGVPTGGGGGIIQVVSTTKTDAALVEDISAGTIGSSNVSGLDLSITPKFSTSKILLMVSIYVGHEGNVPRFGFAIYKGGSALTGAIGDTDGSRVRVTGMTNQSGGASYMAPLTANHLDSPSTTSAITYGIRLFNGSNVTQKLYINRSHSASDVNRFGRPVSSFTAMEVST
tara:strand:+ start:21 stop:572 length:552 start_codon:yes stop_codon:yes gene_type:complete